MFSLVLSLFCARRPSGAGGSEVPASVFAVRLPADFLTLRFPTVPRVALLAVFRAPSVDLLAGLPAAFRADLPERRAPAVAADGDFAELTFGPGRFMRRLRELAFRGWQHWAGERNYECTQIVHECTHNCQSAHQPEPAPLSLRPV